MNVSERFKTFCSKCKHHKAKTEITQYGSEEMIATEYEETDHHCSIAMNEFGNPYPIWQDSKLLNEDDHFMRQFFIEEEQCPLYLEYLMGHQNESK